jgi:hypothetical protein
MKELFQTKCPVYFALILVCAATLHAGCNQQSYGSPVGYDLNKPEKVQLGKVLNEISGLAFNPENNSLLSISDSKRKVIEINLLKHKLKDYTGNVVPPDSDIEDLVRTDSVIYMLASKGIIYAVPPHKQDTTGVRAYPFWSHDRNDFETLYYDPIAKGLIMLCKTCAGEKEEGLHNGYRFDLKTRQFDTTAYYTIDDRNVKEVLKDDNGKFRPSAAAIHPVSRRLYILSSAGNLLVVADTHGQIIEAYQLNPDLYPQAEGIAFAPNGDMFICNEGKYGNATLLMFKYNEKEKKK